VLQTLTSSEFEIVVANNDPVDPVPENFVLPSNCKVIPAPQPGSYAARNTALGHVETTLAAFTDADCIPDENWLAAAVSLLEDDHQINLVAGRIAMFWEGTEPTLVERYDSIFFLQQHNYAAAGYAATANLVVRAKVFADVGLFNGALMSGGDKEWTMRAVADGHHLEYSPDAIVRHPARQSLQEITRKVRRISGGHVAKKRGATRRFILPQFDRLIPAWKALRKIKNTPGVGTVYAFKLFAIHYYLRLVMLAEQIRLIRPISTYQR